MGPGTRRPHVSMRGLDCMRQSPFTHSKLIWAVGQTLGMVPERLGLRERSLRVTRPHACMPSVVAWHGMHAAHCRAV